MIHRMSKQNTTNNIMIEKTDKMETKQTNEQSINDVTKITITCSKQMRGKTVILQFAAIF